MEERTVDAFNGPTTSRPLRYSVTGVLFCLVVHDSTANWLHRGELGPILDLVRVS